MNRLVKNIGTGLLGLVVATGISVPSFFAGRNYQEKLLRDEVQQVREAHEGDGLNLSVTYMNMPSIGGVGTTATLRARFGGKELRIRSLENLTERYDPNKIDFFAINKYEENSARDLREKLIDDSTPGWTYNGDQRVPTLQDIDFNVTATVFDQGCELGNLHGMDFKIVPKK